MQQQKLTASDAAPGEFFGGSVSVDGDTAVVGGLSGDDIGADSGSAYVFVRNSGNWTQQQKLTASDAAPGDYFGISVSVDRETALIGAHLDHDGALTFNSGSTYVFELVKDNDQGSAAWQLANGFNPDRPNDEGTLDSDGDGDLDILEIFQGTDRNNSGDFFGLRNTAVVAGDLSATFRRSTSQTAVAAAGQWSRNLADWHLSGQSDGEVTVNLTESTSGGGAGYELIDLEADVVTGTIPNLYLRLELLPDE
mgnify:CR=1 FL=1